MEESLKILNKVDPAVKIFKNEKGENIIEAVGEIHLERCLKDLEIDYFWNKLIVSDLMIDF